ncbi:DUF1611 domain-containing protein [Paraflavitalea sp. CAU 1676]|uniref:DUF1611 domain-containing protein n=1 Tax=Paraflavitalea sp. CAU 1676 TaxID=3032598 RepID=UPI0023DB2CF3|nr:DUF1611 domain-containing protein [Paraflavitalea sp. CAU 1676]MDF2189763.1 DUF1611 domain-containing protein [Paraflavitalea sp. CAU 1676]
MMNNNAVVITNGLLAEPSAKTAHGLIRGSDRFRILGVIDPVHAGKDAGEVVDGRVRQIPIWSSLEEAVGKSKEPIHYSIVGIAPKGGKLPPELRQVVESSLVNRISVINGLHDFLTDIPEIVSLAGIHGASITDIRKPRSRSELHFWTGRIFEVTCPIVAVLGLETNLGKRTTSRMLTESCRANGINGQMVFTGQTGWMQDGKYGFVLDTTVNDFVSGELEHAIYTCFKETEPDIIFLEGQSGLRNPTGPCGSEYLVSGNAKKTILVFSPKTEYFSNNPAWGKVPTIEEEIALVKLYGSDVIALAMNTRGCTNEEIIGFRDQYEQRTGLPVLLPLQEGVDKIIPVIRGILNQQ